MKVMKSKLSLLILTGLKKKLNTKWFKIVNILLLIMIAFLFNIDTIIKTFGGEFDSESKIYIIDETNLFYEPIKSAFASVDLSVININNEIVKADKSYSELSSQIIEEKSEDIILDIYEEDNTYKAIVTSYKSVDAISSELISSFLNNIKSSIKLTSSGLDKEVLEDIYANMEIERVLLSDSDEADESLVNTIGEMLIPAFIMPFFFLLILTTQMIGAEINEEKSSKSMEIIISSVSPKVHFISKIITANIYALVQCLLFILYLGIGIGSRMIVTKSSLMSSFGSGGEELFNQLISSGLLSNLLKCLPFMIIMIVLSFIAYSLLSGVLASMTTSQEDFSQLQTPMMLFIMAGYFLSIFASQFEKSTFLIIVSCIPFISCILSPVLLMLGQITLIHVIISLVLLILTIFGLIKFGSRIYKAGILNYSSEGLWGKIIDALKSKS